ncbi:MAG: glycosyltransferase family 4 protein [Prevotella sp.]|nr:glycosyltransferase family 4 protein [Prevotella sp.]
MTIAYIYPAFINIGGADKIIISKANYMADHWGYDVYLITDSQNGLPTFFPLSPKVHLIDLDINFFQQYQYPPLKRLMVYLKLMRRYRKAMERTLQQIRPDIIISTFSRDAKFVGLFKKYSKAAIAEVHTTKKNIRALPNLRLKGGFYIFLAAYIERQLNNSAKRFDEVVVLNSLEEDLWKRVRKVRVIHNAVQYYPEEENELKAKNVIYVGRAEYEKAPDRLIDVWRVVAEKHPDWTVSMYCTGAMLDKLKAKVRDYGLEQQVRFMPPTKDMLSAYMSSSICVLTSRFEGFPVVLQEAMGCGIPCVSFNCPSGPRYIITDQEDGYLVRDGDIDGFAEKVCLLMEDEALRRRLGSQAKLSMARYGADVIMAQWRELFERLTKGK